MAIQGLETMNTDRIHKMGLASRSDQSPQLIRLNVEPLQDQVTITPKWTVTILNIAWPSAYLLPTNMEHLDQALMTMVGACTTKRFQGQKSDRRYVKAIS